MKLFFLFLFYVRKRAGLVSLQFRRGKMDIEWLVAAMREANSFLATPTVVVNEPALVRRHRGVRGLDGDLCYPYPATSA
jgi:hypothetical protein